MALRINGQRMEWNGYEFAFIFEDGSVMDGLTHGEANELLARYPGGSVMCRGRYVESWHECEDS